MFDTILIANRGEIACRIARTAGRMGIDTVAVYADADRDSLHVRSCHQAVHIGAAAVADSYLNIEKIIAAARQTAAQAVHPGYGLLSENPLLADACVAAGLVFIGPDAASMRAMGAKSQAKNLMQQHAVPVLGGYQGDDQSAARLRQAAEQTGYPILLKAVAGGGGKGLRAVHAEPDFASALAAVKREAAASFADDRVLIEPYLPRARHVEVQIFADRHGGIVHLFERDCSLQRRHQKVIEESPAPGLSESTRRALHRAAIDAARAIAYVGAGTVEFLLTPEGRFYFMEMNTRLQVEHPVTEMISGQDLVEWQIRVAAGEPLPATQAELQCHGHAIEARICAESPANGFMPAVGRLQIYRPPPAAEHIRIDSGVAQGDAVSPYYDSLLAKLIVVAPDRKQARRRLLAALSGFDIVGVETNLYFLRLLCRLPPFADDTLDDLHTETIAEYQADLLREPPAPPDDAWVAAAVYRLHRWTAPLARSAWARPGLPGWRLHLPVQQKVTLRCRDEEQTWSFGCVDDGLHLVDDPDAPVRLRKLRGALHQLDFRGRQRRLRLYHTPAGIHVHHAGAAWLFTIGTAMPSTAPAAAEETGLCAPLPGSVAAVQVEPGQAVKRGEVLVIIEAMKMEHVVTAACDGVVERIFYQPGDQVAQGAPLLRLVAADQPVQS